MGTAATPPGALRIGLAHGGVVNFASEGEAANPIDPARAVNAGLDYLALGDWHRTCQIGPVVWYARTPEPDRAGGQERGTALLVELQGQRSPPSVTPLSTGTYRWLTRTETLMDGSGLADIDQRLRTEQDLPRLNLRLRLEGTLPLAAHAELQRRLIDLEAAVFHLDADQAALVVRPTQSDLESIDFDGVLRRSADRLKALADDTTQTPDVRRRAEEALIELYLRTVAQQPPEAARHQPASNTVRKREVSYFAARSGPTILKNLFVCFLNSVSSSLRDVRSVSFLSSQMIQSLQPGYLF